MEKRTKKPEEWNPQLYEQQHSFVWQYGADLMELLSPQPEELILDLGCGTGQLTAKIAERVARVIGIDNSPTLINRAKENYPELEFILADATNFSFQKQFDGVFSNAVLHWVQPPEKAITCIWHALKNKGRFVAEFGGKGNVQTIIEATKKVLQLKDFNLWYFPTIGEYATLLESQGFSVSYATLFDRPTPLNGGEKGMGNWLEMFAGSLFNSLSAEEKLAAKKQIEDEVRAVLFRDNIWYADYRRIRIVAEKE